MSPDDGYATARALHARRLAQDWIPIGRKIRFTDRNLADLPPRTEIVLTRKEAIIDRGVDENVLGSPLLALAHLVEVLAKQWQSSPPAAGEIVTTGTLTDAHPVAPGETWTTEIHGLPLHGLRVFR